MSKTAKRQIHREQIISFSEKTGSFKIDDLLHSVEPKFQSEKAAVEADDPTNPTAFCLAIIAAVFAIFGITAAGTVIVPLMKGSIPWTILQIVCAIVLIKSCLIIGRAIKDTLRVKFLNKKNNS